MKLIALLLVAAALGTRSGLIEDAITGPIKRVVVLMMENRSFDHLFGFYNSINPKVNGLSGTERNYFMPGGQQYAQVTGDSPDIGIIDPNHGTPVTTVKMFGTLFPQVNSTPSMDYFVASEYQLHSDIKKAAYVMQMFDPDRVPVITSLADNFALFDRWFASYPGPTWPNRMFALSGTSYGLTETFPMYKGNQSYPQKCIFDSLDEVDLSWKYYYVDMAYENFMVFMNKTKNKDKITTYDKFLQDAKTGNLPNFAWVNPRMAPETTSNHASNDQHPDHSVALGERLYKEVYEALRQGPQWNETLFVLTYDEHGGIYDHVSPPNGAPPPDNEPSFPSYAEFNRLGIRVPTLLISPWVPRGHLISEPKESQKPFPNSEYEHTSLIATLKKIFGLKSFLTKRDAWAATFENELNLLTEPRTDCPWALPDSLPVMDESIHDMKGKPVNDLQRAHLGYLRSLIGHPEVNFNTQAELGDWLRYARERYHEILNRD